MSDLSRWCLAHYDALHHFAGPVATVIAAGAAVLVTWRLGRRQAAIASEQASIARQQANTALDRLRFDLFDMRIAVFEATRNLIMAAFTEGGISTEALSAFIWGTEKSVFLFDNSVTEYIAEMRNRAAQLHYIAAKLSEETLRVGAVRDNYANMEADHTL